MTASIDVRHFRRRAVAPAMLGPSARGPSNTQFYISTCINTISETSKADPEYLENSYICSYAQWSHHGTRHQPESHLASEGGKHTMDSTTLTEFADHLIDDLTVGTDPGTDSLGRLLSETRMTVDDDAILAVMVAAVRLGNVAAYLLAQTSAAAERLAIPARKRLKNGAQLLTELGVAPAAACRAARVGRAAAGLAPVANALRDGALSIEHADAVVRGIAHIAGRTGAVQSAVDHDERGRIVASLMVQTTPREIETRARQIAIALTPAAGEADPAAIPVAENHDLNEMTLHQNDEGRITATLDVDVVTGEELHAALDPLCRPVPRPDGSPDPRSASRRRADAFGQILRTYLSGSERPTSGGVLPHVTLIRPILSGGDTPIVYSSADDTAEGDSVDILGFAGPITAATADLISCDCTATDVTVDDERAPLDVGRTRRLFPPRLRKALGARDRGCAFPGCGRPASWCDAHHMTEWKEGGETSVDNGVLLCRMHHVLIHHTGWEVFLGPDRHPWFRPPADPGSPGRRPAPLRSHARRTLTDLPHAAQAA
ncbi:DUF222 domain-containing protein [Gordonia sp. PP30]|uniref:HNH endonuclease signature motif containing protein n=1 Tax=Gordonia sp. PP30 TaxID=2935861 RepID=UPI0032D57B7C